MRLKKAACVLPTLFTAFCVVQVIFTGPYRICRDFEAEKPCKQEPCAFAHYEEEIHLWTLDREGQFSLEEFVSLMQQYLAAGEL